MANLIGVVSKVVGQVFAVAADGGRRALVEGDRLYAGEQLETGAAGAVAVHLENGAELTLGRDSSLQLSPDLLANHASHVNAPETVTPSQAQLTDVEKLQQAIAAGANQVVLAIADHQRVLQCQLFLLQQMGDQLHLVGARAVQLAAVDHLEVPGEIEMPGDLHGEHPRLAGGDIQGAALLAEQLQLRQWIGPRVLIGLVAGQFFTGLATVQALAADRLALVVAHQVAGNGEEEGWQVVDLLAGIEPRQAQERFLGQVGRHLRTTGAAGDERFQGFLLFGEQARDLKGILLSSAQEVATPELAEWLRLAQGAHVLRLDGIRKADGRAVSRSTMWFPAERFAGIDKAFSETGSITRALSICGVDDYLREVTEISAAHAEPDDVAHLELTPGAIVLEHQLVLGQHVLAQDVLLVRELVADQLEDDVE